VEPCCADPTHLLAALQSAGWPTLFWRKLVSATISRVEC